MSEMIAKSAKWTVQYREDGIVWTKGFEMESEAVKFRNMCVYEFGIWASLPKKTSL